MSLGGDSIKKTQLCIDQGNSSVKAGVFYGNELLETFKFDKFTKEALNSITIKYKLESVIVSSVTNTENDIKQLFASENVHIVILSHETKLPFIMGYNSPETLGKDRIAVVAGASYLKPATNLLIIDAGTAITYDFIDSNGYYHGGNIAPGIDLRLKSLHLFTGKLPMVQAKSEFALLGKNTESAILNGVLNGIIFEINGYIHALKIKYPELSAFLTGGSTFYFDRKLKSAIFVEKNLVLIGLNRILQFNVQK